MFQTDKTTGKITMIIDPRFAQKPCAVCNGRSCSFFNSFVVPGLSPDQSRNLSALQMKADRQRTIQQKAVNNKVEKINPNHFQMSIF